MISRVVTRFVPRTVLRFLQTAAWLGRAAKHRTRRQPSTAQSVVVFLTAVPVCVQARVTPSIPQTRLDAFFKPTAPKGAVPADAEGKGVEEKGAGGMEERVEGKGHGKEEGVEGKSKEEDGKGEKAAAVKSPARKSGGKKRNRGE